MTRTNPSLLHMGSRLTAIMVLMLFSFFESVLADGQLEAGFAEPPKPARPSTYYLLLNGHTDLERIDVELEAFHAVGVRGLCVFDMGARGPEDRLPPAGPPFLSDAWLDGFAHLVAKAGKLDMDVQLAVSSSWDMGGPWVAPKHANKALYQASLQVEGPARFEGRLPFPELPRTAPRDDAGNPVYYVEAALLAIPDRERLSAHEFIFELPSDAHLPIDHVVLHNVSGDLGAKDFSVAISQSDTTNENFTETARAALEQHANPQRFGFTPARARYVRLRVYSGHGPEHARVQLAEFEAYDTSGRNVAGGHAADRTREGAKLVRIPGDLNDYDLWAAGNIHDGRRTGANGTWSSPGPPPLVIRDRAEVQDISAHFKNGQLTWDVPAGKWTLIRYVCANTGERLKVPSPNSDGLATDNFNAEATSAYIRHVTDRLEARLGDLRKTALTHLYLPSYEVRGAIWTDDFPEQFKVYRGYDPRPFLPALNGAVIENREITDRFLYDFRKTLGELLVDAYYRKASASARRVGLGVEAEAGGPGPPVHQVPVDALAALGAIDAMRGEFWPFRPDSRNLWVVKETASAAHIYGRTRVHMEAFTSFHHWQDGPFDLKPSADRAFCEGMNHVVWHTASHQPDAGGDPGWVYGAGTHLTPRLVWWPMAKPFIDYLSRCSFLLQQGLFVADVCYYYGDQGYNFVPPKQVDPSLGYGFDYDVTNAEVILDRMTVRDGRITLPDGMSYELLVLPERDDIDPAVLRKIAALVKAGATVVGPKPTKATGLHDHVARDREVHALADSVWGPCDGKTILEHAHGHGRVVWGRSLREILRERGIGPDFAYTADNEDAEIDFIHRRTPDADIYFVSNKRPRVERLDAVFRVQERVPELWCPASGDRVRVDAWKKTDGGILVPFELAPHGSMFVVFQAASTPSDASRPATQRAQQVVDVTGSWEVTFPAANEAARFESLVSWTTHEREPIRHYSGLAQYRKEINISSEWLEENKRLQLDLGDLWAVARIRLNGQSVGIVWTPPYRVDITQSARPGMNTLEIEVANTWANRIVGDTGLPEEQRRTRTNITGTGTPRVQWADLPLRDSGLFGPVRLIRDAGENTD
jgi:hypothetical protein